MAEADQSKTDHIGDAETVYMSHPDTEGVGTSLGLAFKEVWAPKGWYQVSRSEFDEWAARATEQHSAFVAAGDARMPDDGDAQDLIMAGDVQPPAAPAKAHAGGAKREDV